MGLGVVMEDERQATYQRLVERLDDLLVARFPSYSDMWVQLSEVKELLAVEFLIERRGAGSQTENIERREQ